MAKIIREYLIQPGSSKMPTGAVFGVPVGYGKTLEDKEKPQPKPSENDEKGDKDD